jgi:hypothetical protein
VSRSQMCLGSRSRRALCRPIAIGTRCIRRPQTSPVSDACATVRVAFFIHWHYRVLALESIRLPPVGKYLSPVYIDTLGFLNCTKHASHRKEHVVSARKLQMTASRRSESPIVWNWSRCRRTGNEQSASPWGSEVLDAR